METPPPPLVLTVEQAADLRCVGLGLFITQSANGQAQPVVQVYLDRLRRSDPSRDWKAMAPTFSADMTYGDFMGEMNICQDRAARMKQGPRPPAEQ